MQEGVYRHYKGHLYRVICQAKHSETLEDLVVYQDVIHAEKYWARPVAMWAEMVTVGGQTIPRFTYLGDSLSTLDSRPLFSVIEAIKDYWETDNRFSETNRLAFYHRPTHSIVYFDQALLGMLEDGEDGPEYDEDSVRRAETYLDHPDEYTRIPGDEVDLYDEIDAFLSELPTPLQASFERAQHGKAWFRRFREIAAHVGVLEHWYAYLDAAHRRAAREWCDAYAIEWWKGYLGKP